MATSTKTSKQSTTSKRTTNKTSSASSQSKIKGSIIGGAVAGGGVGYVASEVITANTANEPTSISAEAELPEVDYQITRYRLSKTKNQLKALTVRSDTATVPAYNSTGVVPKCRG